MGTRRRQTHLLTPSSWRRRLAVAAATVGLATGQVLFLGASSVAASVSPASATLTIAAGSSGTETKTVGVPAVPPKADIELAIDTTGSMDPSIAQAKTDALNIVSGVQSLVPDTQFAVVSFKDAVDGADEYAVLQSMTANAAAVSTAINGLPAASGGGDAAEAHNLVFHNSYNPATGGDLGWRSGTRKFVVVISDAEPHGAGTDGFAGCADTSVDPHGLSTATELAGMNTAERTLLMIRQVSPVTTTTLACYQSLTAAAFTGGSAVDGGGSLATQIVNLITAAFANVNDVHLEVASASPAPAAASWISFSPASVGPVPAPSTQTFTLTATVPASTPGGTYTFDIVALADGIDIGHQVLTIRVFSYLSNGAFVISRGNAAVGTDVTFWGAQWWKRNPLGSSSAPSQFKGFAGTTSSPPACGSDWTTDPGNSTPPPDGPLPEYMGVIVSSAITSSGPVISGDTVHIVIVKTNAGYASDPGHAGTGTVVAVVC